MRFVANLRHETIEAFEDEDIQPAAYLLSAHRISPSLLEAARVIRGKGVPLYADNGTKSLIDDVIDRFEARAGKVRVEVRKLRKRLGHIPRGREIPSALRAKADALAEEVVAHCTTLSGTIDWSALVDAQLSMHPTAVFAQEDFATACLVALGLERETTGWPVSRFNTRNRRSLQLCKRVAKDPRCKEIETYCVFSAMDYNTARAAGRMAARAGVKNAAIGIAGITRDNTATDFYVIGKASFKLDRPVPRRYVRLAQILSGLADGFLEKPGTISSFHCLGLGAPTMFPIAAGALNPGVQLTTDATSPIHDAVRDHVMYDPSADGDRKSMEEIVQTILAGGDWPFLSPFSRTFREKFGHDPDRARRWWREHNTPPVSDALLETSSALTAALPLFCEAEPEIKRKASKTHIANNHWVLDQLCRSFPDGPDGKSAAMAAFERWFRRPASVTTRGLRAGLQVLMRRAA
jgi:hypothetical protein